MLNKKMHLNIEISMKFLFKNIIYKKKILAVEFENFSFK